MFDAEKAEKVWLMSRIDGLETQLRQRNEECASLRAAAGARPAGRGAPPPEQPSGADQVSSYPADTGSPVVVTASTRTVGSSASPETLAAPTAAGKTSAAPPAAGGSPSLKE